MRCLCSFPCTLPCAAFVAGAGWGVPRPEAIGRVVKVVES